MLQTLSYVALAPLYFDIVPPFPLRRFLPVVVLVSRAASPFGTVKALGRTVGNLASLRPSRASC